MKRTPFVAGSDTSAAAAEAIAPNAATLRAKVLRFIEGRGLDGATDDEVQASLEMSGNTERPRRRELEGQCLIGDSGKRRLTKSKRQAVVWVGAVYLPKIESKQKPSRQTVQGDIPSFLDLFGESKEDV